MPGWRTSPRKNAAPWSANPPMRPNLLPDLPDEQITLGEPLAGRTGMLWTAGALAVGAAGLFGWLRADAMRWFFHSWLLNAAFYTSLSLGALFLVPIFHVTRAGWAVAVRRLAEVFGANFAVLAVLWVPVLLGIDTLYEWADPLAVENDPLLSHKAPYLNVPFFVLRTVGFLGLWWLLGRYLLHRSTEQDATGDPVLTLRLERASAPALLLLALTATFAAFDWIMALEPRWYSTIFGVYFFSGAMVGVLAALPLVALGLQRAGRLRGVVTVEHYHDLGKLLFAFVVFWGYIAFSQFLLIWYGNIPEETQWYRRRLSDGWENLALVLLAGHLLIPFFGLLSRHAKRRTGVLAFWSAWLLAMHWLDLYWLVMPAVKQPLGFSGAMVDGLLAVGMGALYLAGAARIAATRCLVPRRDPRLVESLVFENT